MLAQATALTGRRFLNGHASAEAQYIDLMTSGVAFAERFALTLGIALTDEQMAQLTNNIVWLIEQNVTLPDGSRQTVLAPQVYLARNAQLTPTGALVTSEGTANAATVQGLKAQLAQGNLTNIAAQDSKLAAALQGDGAGRVNFSIGTGTVDDANRLGQIWVGDGARLISDQSECPGCLISADGTRIYRPPETKTSSYATTGIQANFVQRTSSGEVISNGHLNVTP